MTNAQTAGRINSILLLVIGLLAGAIAGYLYGRSGSPGGSPATAGNTALLNDRLAPENQWIVDGMNCPMPGCTNMLAECSGELPRKVRDWINRELAAGRSGQDVRSEIIRVHGDNLFKTFPKPGRDST